jgi:4a-hydroxytetrahydrobiopterin dehydratase
MKTRTELVEMRCSPSIGKKALTPIEISTQLSLLPGWTFADGAINRTFKFGNYHETIDFVNALANVVHLHDHHPDLFVSYNRCTVALNTHDVKGISENDFIIAALADALYQSRA